MMKVIHHHLCHILFFSFFKLHFRFWGTWAEHARQLRRYTHGSVLCFSSPLHPHLVFPPGNPSPRPPPTGPPLFPLQTPVFSTPLSVSMCSHFSSPTYEWEYAVFHFLFSRQFAENDVLQIHPCPYKRHKLIIFDCCIIFHGVYVPHFPNPVYHRWAFGLVSGLFSCKQCCNEHSCACVLIVELFIVLWIYTQ